MMKKWIVLVVVAATAASTSFAEGGPRKHQGPKGDREGGLTQLLDKPQVLKKLGITDEQVDQLKESAYAARKDVIAAKAKRDVANVDLRRLMDADKVDEAAIMAAVEAVGALDTELHKARVKSQLDVIGILGKETYDKIKAMKHHGQRAKHDGKRNRDGKQGRRGDRNANAADSNAPPWMQDEMLPPDDGGV